MAKQGIVYPTNDAYFGGLESTTDTMELAKSKLYHLLLTLTGEVRMNPTFGINLYKLIFENDGMTDVESVAKEEIDKAVKRWSIPVNIKNVITKFNSDENILNIQVVFQLKEDTTQNDSIVVNIAM